MRNEFLTCDVIIGMRGAYVPLLQRGTGERFRSGFLPLKLA